jgi:hypothetical protein
LPDTPDDDAPETPRQPHSGPEIAIETEMKASYLDYAMSVIVSRAIPDLRRRRSAGGPARLPPLGLRRRQRCGGAATSRDESAKARCPRFHAKPKSRSEKPWRNVERLA